MLYFYRYYTTVYHNNKEIRTRNCGTILTDIKPEDYTEELTWDNLTEKYHDKGFCYPFNIWNFKKGKRVSFFNSIGERIQKDIKEWKEPLNLSVKHEYILYEPSIDYVLKYIDGTKAIQYLIERGVSVVGK